MRLGFLLSAVASVNGITQCDFALSNGAPVTNAECRYLCDMMDSTSSVITFSQVCHFQTYELASMEVILPDQSCFSHKIVGMADIARPQLSGFAYHWTNGPGECQLYCQSNSDCVYFAWMYQGNGGWCFLKDADMVRDDELQDFMDFNERAVTGPAFCTDPNKLHARTARVFESRKRLESEDVVTSENSNDMSSTDAEKELEQEDFTIETSQNDLAADADEDRSVENSFVLSHPYLAQIYQRLQNEGGDVRTITLAPRMATSTSATSPSRFGNHPRTTTVSPTTTTQATTPPTTTTTTAATTSFTLPIGWDDNGTCDIGCLLRAYCARCETCCEPFPRIEVTVYD